jgi:hypothetical protein
VGQDGGRRDDSDVRGLHRRLRPLRGDWGSVQLYFTERASLSTQNRYKLFVDTDRSKDIDRGRNKG